MKTELQNTNLWYDGTIEVLDEEGLVNALLKQIPIEKLAVSDLAINGVLQFNQRSDRILSTKVENRKLNFEWLIPKEYLELDIDAYTKHLVHPIGLIEKREIRLQNEIAEFKRRGLLDFLRVIIYIVDTFRKDKIMWGIGRGSSCASYLLFLIGLHLVDPIVYDIPINEFLRDK